ncbi:MAG: hypothetical protein J7K73_02335 [Nanoarchaeota archaeon]|nr:hypothetical protein [Nanoarchaeota archaeon]
MGLLKRSALKVRYGAGHLKARAAKKIGGKFAKVEKTVLSKLGNEVALIRKSAADLLKEFNFQKEKQFLLRKLIEEVKKESKQLEELRVTILKEEKLLPYVRAVQSEMIMGKNADPAVVLKKERQVESTLHALIQMAHRETSEGYMYRNTLISQKRALEALLKIVEDQIKWLGISQKQISRATTLDKELEKATKNAKRLVGREAKELLKAQHSRLGI